MSESDSKKPNTEDIIAFYKQNVDDLRTLLGQHQKREQFKVACYEQLSQNLSDSQQTISEQNEKLSKAERTITVLQNRLMYLKADTTPFMLLAEEMVLPSKQHFDQLVLENARLKRELMYSSYDSAGYEKLRAEIQLWKSKAVELDRNTTKLVSENEEFRNTLKDSSDVKDQRISNLKQEIEEYEQNLRVYQIICEALSRENDKLKTEVKSKVKELVKVKQTPTYVVCSTPVWLLLFVGR